MNEINLKPVQHAVFDAYGTLFDVHSAASRHQSRLGEKAQAVSALWRTKQLEYTWLRSLMKRYVDFWQVTQDALDYALDSNGIDDQSLRWDLLNAYHELACYPEVPETLRNLKELELGTAILSNGASKNVGSRCQQQPFRKCYWIQFFRWTLLGFLNLLRLFIKWPLINLDLLRKKYCSFPQTPGMSPELPLLVFRLSGSIVSDKQWSVFQELRFLKLKRWMQSYNICLQIEV